jgi:plastocyanin
MGPRFSLAVIAVLGVAVIVGVWAGRSQSQSSAAPQAPSPLPTPMPSPAPGHVDILSDPTGNTGGVYSPSVYRVRVGQRVTWTNLDTVDHTATADDGAFNTDVLGPGQSASWTPKHAGTYSYSDYLNPDMHGVIVVTTLSL